MALFAANNSTGQLPHCAREFQDNRNFSQGSNILNPAVQEPPARCLTGAKLGLCQSTSRGVSPLRSPLACPGGVWDLGTWEPVALG